MEIILVVLLYLPIYLGLVLVPASPIFVPALWVWVRSKDSPRDRGVLTGLAVVIAFGGGWFYSTKLFGDPDDKRVVVCGTFAALATLYAFIKAPRPHPHPAPPVV